MSDQVTESRTGKLGGPIGEGQVQDKYDQLMRLAHLFDSAGEQMREWAGLGAEVLADPDVSESAELATRTHTEAADDILAATSGKDSLLSRSIELDADALVLRATVLTYRWIDDLQIAAARTLGAIAGRAVGYLAPEVALGGAIVSAGLIETDALDRDGLAAYLNELAAQNPDLMDHFTSGGGGLLDGLQMRALLTVGVLGGSTGRAAATGGLRATGVEPFAVDAAAAFRDVAGGFAQAEPATATEATPGAAPTSVEQLMETLSSTEGRVRVQQVAPGRYIAYLPGAASRGAQLRLVGGDRGGEIAAVVDAIEAAVEDGAHVMLVGSAQGGVAAAEIASTAASDRFVIDQVVTVGAPSAHVPRIPEHTRVLSLEDRSDPVALLGSLINQGVSNRLTVVYDGGDAHGPAAYVVGGRAADTASHPELRAAIQRIQELGYLAS